MSIIIESIDSEQGTTVRAHVRHELSEFVALVYGTRESLRLHLRKECLVEMTFERVIAWHEIQDFDDESSCIKATPQRSDAITIQRRVHSVIAVDADSSIVDLYLRTGPEFLTIDVKELGGFVPQVGTGLEVTVVGLCFYPTSF